MATKKLTCTADVSISQKYSGNAYNAADRLAFGAGAASGDNYYALLKFSALGLDADLYEINKAVLKLTKITGALGFNASFSARACRVTSNWNESTTYDSAPSVTTTGASSAVSVGAGHSGTITMDVTAIVKAWQSGSSQYGVRIEKTTSGGSMLKVIADRTSANGAYITVTYSEKAPAPTVPTVTAPGTITTDSKTFSWAASTDHIFASSDLSYQLQISLDGGTSWGDTLTVAENQTSLQVNLRSVIGLKSGQYYYNSKFKVRVRAVTPEYDGTVYYSGWSTSSVGIVNYRKIPAVASSVSLSASGAYEGQQITVTVGRPSTYNSYDSGGEVMNLTYTAKLIDGTTLGSVTVAATESTADIVATLPSKTNGKDDLATAIYVVVSDAEGQTGAASSNVAFSLWRYRSPIVTVTAVDRSQNSGVATVLVTDTGYSLQTNTQIASVEYSVDSGEWVSVTPTWTGLKTGISISGLESGKKYQLRVRVTNTAPEGITAKSGTTTIEILEYSPAGMFFRDSANGATGLAAKSFRIGTTDAWQEDIPEGSGYIEGTLYVGALNVRSEWIDLDIADGFDVYAGTEESRPMYKVCGNVVTIKGVLTPNSEVAAGISNVAIASGIPAELRPTTNPVYICQGSGMNRWACTVLTNGNIGLARYGTTEAIAVPAGAWLPFCITYMI